MKRFSWSPVCGTNHGSRPHPDPGQDRMQAFARKSGPQLLVAIGLVLIGVAFGVVIGRLSAGPTGSDLAAQATQIPVPSPAPTARPSPRPTPSAEPTVVRPSTTIASPVPADAAAVVAIWDSLERLRAVQSYRFTSGMAGFNPLRVDEVSNTSIGARGSLVQQPALAMDAVFGTQMVEFGGAAGISSSQRYVLIGDTIWAPRPGESPDPQPAARSLDELMVFLPEGMATRFIIPFAAGFEQVGVETRRGIDTLHYRMTSQGERVYASTTGCVGDWSGDLWVIADGGYLGEAELRCSPADASSRSNLQVQLQVTDVDDPTIKVEPPN